MIFKKIIIIYFLLSSSLYCKEASLELIEIYKNLRCIVCQGQSIADSNSDFASTIKLVVKDQIKKSTWYPPPTHDRRRRIRNALRGNVVG